MVSMLSFRGHHLVRDAKDEALMQAQTYRRIDGRFFTINDQNKLAYSLQINC